MTEADEHPEVQKDLSRAPMSRPNFTVVVNSDGQECNFDANHLAVTFSHGVYALAFECSGEIRVEPIKSIIRVDFYHEGASWCPFCDQALTAVEPEPGAGPAGDKDIGVSI